MKNFLHKKSGFSLVELMIVIAIIGLLIVAMNAFTANPNIHQTRAENFAHFIFDTIRNAKNDTTIWRLPRGMQSIDSRKLVITTTSIEQTASGVLTSGQLQPSFTEKSYSWKLMDNDSFYKIEKIDVSTSALSDNYQKWTTADDRALLANNWTWTQVNTLTLEMFSNTMKTTSNPTVANILSFRITVDYRGKKRFIYGDAVLGNVMVKNLQ